MKLARLVVPLLVFSAMVSGCNLRPEASSSRATNEKELAIERARLELSELCATAADRFWKRSGNEEIRNRSKGNEFVGPVLSYTSHYNRELRRCLVMVTDRALRPVRNGLYNESHTVLYASEGSFIAEQTFTVPDDSAPTTAVRWGGVVPLNEQRPDAFKPLMER